METTYTASTASYSWEISPTNVMAGTVLAILFFYVFFRHVLFVLMFMDIVLGWLRKFRWFPKEGKRRKTFIHWLIAIGLFVGFIILAAALGWLELIAQ
ncbi:hypothetical protein ABMC88_01230 [Sulfitobacter sp. HNIBRBA2951]|uniref:hypothetical protein n=1 Tax=Sulfitobacter aquimarinus TaxID=3158557 RepID=UPI0032DF830D